MTNPPSTKTESTMTGGTETVAEFRQRAGTLGRIILVQRDIANATRCHSLRGTS